MNGDFLWKFDRGRFDSWDDDEYEDEKVEHYTKVEDELHEIMDDGYGWDSPRRYANGMTNADLERKKREVREAEREMQRILEEKERKEKLQALARAKELAEQRRLEEEARKPFIEKKSSNRKIFVIKGGVE